MVSDVVDAQGHQYIGLVMEGGGVLGIALVGYTYALESVGLRVRSVGGASAGAINALMFAAVHVPGNAKSEKLLEILSSLDMFSLVNGDSDARDFVRALVEDAGPINLGFKAAQVIDNVREDLGPNPGDEFVRWLTTNLAASRLR